MPIYEYQCGSCGHVFDALQKISDAPLTECPQCHQAELKKLLSAPKFRLKGVPFKLRIGLWENVVRKCQYSSFG